MKSAIAAYSAPSGLSSCLNIRYRSRSVASNSFDRVTSPATSFAVYWGLDKCTYSSDETVVLGMTADPVPHDSVLLHDGQRAIIQADANRIDFILAFQIGRAHV